MRQASMVYFMLFPCNLLWQLHAWLFCVWNPVLFSYWSNRAWHIRSWLEPSMRLRAYVRKMEVKRGRWKLAPRFLDHSNVFWRDHHSALQSETAISLFPFFGGLHLQGACEKHVKYNTGCLRFSGFFPCLACQMCLCTHSVWFHASSADPSMKNIVFAFTLAPVCRLLSVFLLLCLKALPNGRYISELRKWET